MAAGLRPAWDLRTISRLKKRWSCERSQRRGKAPDEKALEEEISSSSSLFFLSA
jgi:hypothetical protein